MPGNYMERSELPVESRDTETTPVTELGPTWSPVLAMLDLNSMHHFMEDNDGRS